MFGGSGKCARCNKSVYAAEQKLAENKMWHSLCWALEFKEREANKKAHKDEVSYNKAADVAPAYYRTADAAAGVPARLEVSDKTSSPSAAQIVSALCQCGHKADPGAKFCGGCGTKII
jgi:hypothetical protein